MLRVLVVVACPLASQREDRLAADALDLPARQSTVARFRDRRLVGVDELELERRRSDVEDEDVHVQLMERDGPDPRDDEESASVAPGDRCR